MKRWKPLAAGVAAALMMCWPAADNGYPLLYPDSINYIGDGRLVAGALFLHRIGNFGWMRSVFYSLGILMVHWNRSPWPVVALQAGLTAWVLWLVVRSVIARSTLGVYVGLVAVLSVCTGLGWFVSLVLPDALGPLLFLGIYLLVFARETLSRREAGALLVLVWWFALAHTTHLLVGLVVCGMLLVVALWRRELTPRVRQVCGVMVLAVVAQVAVNAYLYGEWSLEPERPPMLTARVTADGPGRLYVQQHCAERHWAVCDFAGKLTGDENDFLWSSDGVMGSAAPGAQEAMRREEIGFVLATVRAYPREQMGVSLRNFGAQLRYFDLDDFGNSTWMESALNGVLPGSEARYRRSLQARDLMPSDPFSAMQMRLVLVSLVVVVVGLVWMWRREPRLVGLAGIVGVVLVLNAAVTGVLSGLDARYEARVMWMLPLVAGLMVVRVAAPGLKPPAREMDSGA